MATKRCFRCNGAKKMFRKGGGYSLVDSGGEHVDCPLCDGKGLVSVPEPIAIDPEDLPEIEAAEIIPEDLQSSNLEDAILPFDEPKEPITAPKKRGRPAKGAFPHATAHLEE